MKRPSSISRPVKMGEIAGFCDPQFESVAEEFERNFQQRGEVGASVCVTLEGETVVDLWGGSTSYIFSKYSSPLPQGRGLEYLLKMYEGLFLS